MIVEAGSSVMPQKSQVESISIPLVTIGIPTYNRMASLARAIQSARRQTYPNVEIVISDNASTDGTQELCESTRDSDARIRYFRKQINAGAEENFASVLREGRGELFMWLADDDWIDENYVERCAAVLNATDDFVLVSGRAKYYSEDVLTRVGAMIQLQSEYAADRVQGYYETVDDNAVFYGIMRRKGLRMRKRRAIAADWYFVAALAVTGKVGMIPECHIHRSLRGASASLHSLAGYYGLKGRAARNPYGKIGRLAVREILWENRAFRTLSLWKRVAVASRAYQSIYRRYYLRLISLESLGDCLSLAMHAGTFSFARLIRRLARMSR